MPYVMPVLYTEPTSKGTYTIEDHGAGYYAILFKTPRQKRARLVGNGRSLERAKELIGVHQQHGTTRPDLQLDKPGVHRLTGFGAAGKLTERDQQRIEEIVRAAGTVVDPQDLYASVVRRLVPFRIASARPRMNAIRAYAKSVYKKDHGYGRIDVTKHFRRERKVSPSSCAAGSFRAKKTKTGALLTFCCPKGQWQPRKKRCKVGMRLQSLGRPR